MKKIKKRPVSRVRKKHYKAVIITLSFFLVLVFGGFIMICSLLLNMHSDSLYPTNVLVQSEISAFSRTMDTVYYMPLQDIAISIAKEGTGPLLTPIGGSKTFDYESDVLSKLAVSTGEGRIIVRQGSGNVQNDIVASTSYYYDFMGHLSPTYKEKVAEEGQLNNYYTTYSAGYIDTGNFLKQNGYYVIAFECNVSENGRYLFVVYATESQKELREMIGLLKEFSSLALEGDKTSVDSEEEVTIPENETTNDEKSADWDTYLENNRVKPEEQNPLNDTVKTEVVSGNTVSDTDEFKENEETTIDLQIEE